MKSPILFLAAAALGFLGGWLVKPAPQPTHAPPPASPAAPQPQPPVPRPAAPTPPAPPTGSDRSSVSRPPLPTPPAPADADTGESAKFGRLAEMLGLDEAAQTALKLALDETRAAYLAESGNALTSRETLDHIAKVAGRLEQAIDDLLVTPEQKSAFAALRQRERDNRIETKAQREMSVLTGLTDILPEQREAILTHLRERADTEAAKLPAELALAVASPVMPLGPLGLGEDALLAMLNAAEQDPALAQADVFTRQAQRMEAQLGFLQTVLTPAQYAQVEQAAAAQRAIHERIKEPRPSLR